jgi:hypothetical protein
MAPFPPCHELYSALASHRTNRMRNREDLGDKPRYLAGGPISCRIFGASEINYELVQRVTQ